MRSARSRQVGPGPRVSVAGLHEAIEQLGSLQPINARTGSVHAAAWVVPGKGIQLVREDVGRHNALDKAIGALVQVGCRLRFGLHADHQPGEFRDGAEGRDSWDFVSGGPLGADRVSPFAWRRRADSRSWHSPAATVTWSTQTPGAWNEHRSHDQDVERDQRLL